MYSTRETFVSGISNCVKIEPLESNFKETVSSGKDTFSFPDILDVKSWTMQCPYCPFANNITDELKSHLFSAHPTKAAIVPKDSCATAQGYDASEVTFFCVKETCTHTSTHCSAYEEHLIHCYSLHPTQSQNELERLKATLKYIFDYHRWHCFKVAPGFLHFMSSLMNICASEDSFIKSFFSYLLEREIGIHVENGCDSQMQDIIPEDLVECNSSIPIPHQDLDNKDIYNDSAEFKISTVYSESEQPVWLIPPKHYQFKNSCKSQEETALIEENHVACSVAGNSDLEIDIAEKPTDISEICQAADNKSDQGVCELSDVKDDIKNEENVTDGHPCPTCNTVFPTNLLLEHHFNMQHREEDTALLGDVGNTENQNVTDLLDDKIVKATEEKISIKLVCNECGKNFGRSRDLARHMRTHTGEKPFKCNECGRSFSDGSELPQHMRTHTGERPFKCNVCDKSFSQSSHLHRHMRTHTGEKPFQCKVCGQSFSQSGNLDAHLRTHTGERPFRCEECGKSFRKSNHLHVHVKTHSGEKPFKCKECDKAFSNSNYLLKHMKTHTGEKPYKCDVCGKGFRERAHLLGHIRTHTGEKPFQCTQCDKSCTTKSELSRHLRTHSGEVPFRCTECNKGFRDKTDFCRHMRIHTGERPFKCGECGKGFSDSSDLRRHMKTHTGDKPYSCVVCGDNFSQSNNLHAHMRKHTGEKPFNCGHCCKDFSNKSDLNRHMKRHSGEKPFICEDCGEGFSRSGNLTAHMKTHATT